MHNHKADVFLRYIMVKNLGKDAKCRQPSTLHLSDVNSDNQHFSGRNWICASKTWQVFISYNNTSHLTILIILNTQLRWKKNLGGGGNVQCTFKQLRREKKIIPNSSMSTSPSTDPISSMLAMDSLTSVVSMEVSVFPPFLWRPSGGPSSYSSPSTS